MSEYKKIEDGKAELTCTIEGEEWAAAKAKAFNKLKKNLQLKGFRKGQVPETLAKKNIYEGEIIYEAATASYADAFETGIKEHDIQLIDKAGVEFKELDADHVIFTFSCPVKPDVTLGDYKSLKYEVEEAVVEDKDVEDEINRVRDRKADLELKEDGAVEDGDTAVIDFEGFKDGVPFDGGKAENYDLVIGSDSFVPGFESQLIGMKAEEEKEINVTFPENYHVDDLKGAPVVFKVKVHEIKKKVLPELNEEFVKDLKIADVNTVDEYRAYIKDVLVGNKKKMLENEAEQDLLDKFADMCTVNVPKVMIERETQTLYEEQSQRLLYQGINMEQYQQVLNQSKDDMLKILEPSATSRVKTTLCLEALAKAENVAVSDEEIETYYNDLAGQYGLNVDDVKKYVLEDDAKEDLLIKKAIAVLKNKE